MVCNAQSESSIYAGYKWDFWTPACYEIMLWIVPGQGNRQAREEKIQESIRQIRAVCPGHPIRIEVRELDAIPLSAAGKHRFTSVGCGLHGCPGVRHDSG